MNPQSDRPANAAHDTEHTTIISRVPVEVPYDLSQWIEPAVLRRWVEEALESDPSWSRNAASAPEDWPHRILGLLLFSLCTGRSSCREIAIDCQSDPWLRSFCPKEVPFSKELKRFCRTHHHILERVLNTVLIRAAREKHSLNGHLPPGLEATLTELAAGRVITIRTFSDDDEEDDA